MELGPQGNAEAQASESWLGNFTCAHGRGQRGLEKVLRDFNLTAET